MYERVIDLVFICVPTPAEELDECVYSNSDEELNKIEAKIMLRDPKAKLGKKKMFRVQ